MTSPHFTNGVRVRCAEPDDFDDWLPLWLGYNRFYGRDGVFALSDAVTQATWSRFFDAYEPMFALVAQTADGALIGLAHFLYHRSTTMLTANCYLQDLFTDEAARGQGVGRALIEAVYAQAKADGLERVYWQTHESNATARRLYDHVAELSGHIVYRKSL